MKLLCVIPSLRSGGAERVLSLLANSWVQEGHSVTILTLEGEHEPFFELSPQIKIHFLGVSGVSHGRLSGLIANTSRIIQLRRAIKLFSPEIVLSFLHRTNIRVVFASIGLGIPVVVSERTVPGVRPLGVIWESMRELTYRFSSKVVVQSETIRQRFSNSIKARTIVIPNPVPIPAIDTPEFRLSARTIVSIGRFTEEKRFDRLIEVFSQLKKDYPDWNLVIFGDGPERKKLERLIESMHLEHFVTLPGRIRKPYSTLRGAEIFVSCSRVEGFPMALCEAMSCGVACVATKSLGAVEDIIQHGSNGLLAERENSEALLSALRLLVSDETLRKRLGKEAKKISERFSLEKIQREWITLFKSLLGRR